MKVALLSLALGLALSVLVAACGDDAAPVGTESGGSGAGEVGGAEGGTGSLMAGGRGSVEGGAPSGNAGATAGGGNPSGGSGGSGGSGSLGYLPCEAKADCDLYGGGKVCCAVGAMHFCTKPSACPGEPLP